MSQEIQESNIQIPLHRKIAESLSGQVKNGKLKPGERLPSERQIARQFNASRATVRTALQHLEQSGLIARRERRSALVAIRRDIAPSIRIACSSNRLVSLLSRLGEMQILPSRCQIHLVDFQQPGAIDRLMSSPAAGSDVVFCEMEYVHCFRQKINRYQPINVSDLADVHMPMIIQDLCIEQRQYTAIPVGINPIVLYRNTAMLRNIQPAPPIRDWRWDRMESVIEQLAEHGSYGLQIRPCFGHIMALMRSRGCRYYNATGRIAVSDSPIFESTLRLMARLLHGIKGIPILAKVEQLNLFAQKRCALAVGGFDMAGVYHERLGNSLEVGLLPQEGQLSGSFSGIAAVATPGVENMQMILDLLHKMLSANTQRVITQVGGAMPVRNELLNPALFEGMNLPESASKIFLEAITRCDTMYLPADFEHKVAADNLMLELWLNLDSIDNICRRFKSL
jgi:DNA-binding transcriptional regulator YhcF (GntR family)